MSVTTIGRLGSGGNQDPPEPEKGAVLLAALLVMPTAALVAWLITEGLALVALALLLVLPGFIVAHRYPLLAVGVWLAVTQFVVEGSGGAGRRVYWLTHRAAPAGVVVLLLVGAALAMRGRLPRLGVPEFLMGGYLCATTFSILFESETAKASLFLLFDRVAAPMALYLLVRYLQPGADALRKLMPIAVFVVIAQSLVGLAAWVSPGVLPNVWLEREGTRTIGSLGHPNVLGVTLITAGLFLFHGAHTLPLTKARRLWYEVVFCLAFFMVFMTFGRAPWLAAVLVLIGLTFLYPGPILRVFMVITVTLALTLEVGGLRNQTRFAAERITSAEADESALSRLPVVYASLEMFKAKPIAGWGYGNFDRFDREFQVSFTGLVIADKDHASHNLYLTILAEQGLIGIGLYLAPALWWLAVTPSRMRRLPKRGFVSRKLVGILWLALLAHVVVNNFSNMKVVYGLGLWWLTLGLIASLVDHQDLADEAEPQEAPATRDVNDWVLAR